MTETLEHGTSLRVLSESYPMNTNLTGFRWFSKTLCIHVLGTKVTSTYEGLTLKHGTKTLDLQTSARFPGNVSPLHVINVYYM